VVTSGTVTGCGTAFSNFGDRNTFTGLTAISNTGLGFDIVTDSHNTLTFNVATNNGGGGFLIDLAAHNTLMHNSANGNTIHGFEIGGDSTTLDTNSANGNGSDGFRIDSRNNKLLRNIAIGNFVGFGVFGGRKGEERFARLELGGAHAPGVRD